jgi:hypothetical protein
MRASLEKAPTEIQLRDENYCRDLIRLGAHQCLIYTDHKAKADTAGENVSAALWYYTQGYFLRLTIPDDAANDVYAWRKWVSNEHGGENHVGKLTNLFKNLASGLVKSEPTKFSEKFFYSGEKGKATYWQTRISHITTAIADGVNPVSRGRHGEFLVPTIDAARKERTKIKEQINKDAEAAAAAQEYSDAIATPEGKRLAIAHQVGMAIESTLLKTADLDELLFILKQCKPLEVVGKTMNSQRKRSFSDDEYEAAVQQFNRELDKIKSFTLANAVEAKALKESTTATIAAMSSGMKDEHVAAVQQDDDDNEIDIGMTETEAYDYGALSFNEGTRFADADKPDWGTQNYVMFVKGYRQAALAWLNHPSNAADCDRRDEVMEDAAASGKALK